MNTILFVIFLLVWFVVLFGDLDKKYYGVLGYPVTFCVILVLGKIFGIA